MKFSVDKSGRRINLPKDKIDELVREHKEEYFKNYELDKKRKEDEKKRHVLEKKWTKEIQRVRSLELNILKKQEKRKRREEMKFNFLHTFGLVKTNQEIEDLAQQKKVSKFVKDLKKLKTNEFV